MERNWDYRKHHQNKAFKRRLENISARFNWVKIDDDLKIYQPKWYQIVDKFYIYRSVSTTKWDSQYKGKWRSNWILGFPTKTRTHLKKETQKILKEYGI